MISFRKDVWCSLSPLMESLWLPPMLGLKAKLCDAWFKGLSLPKQLPLLCPQLLQWLKNLHIGNIDDVPIWANKDDGFLTVKAAKNYLNQYTLQLEWSKFIWTNNIPRARSLIIWKYLQNRLPLDSRIQHYGIHLCSRCSLCNSSYETMEHFFFCTMATIFWSWLANPFQSNTICTSIDHVLNFMQVQCNT